MRTRNRSLNLAKIIGALAVIALIIFAVKWFAVDEKSNPDLETPSPTTETSGQSDVDVLILVNADHKLPDNYSPRFVEKGAKIAELISTDFADMREAARTQGIILMVNDAYRSPEEQARLYKELGSSLAAKPGYSEHETGLVVDFSFSGLSESDKTKMWDWLRDNAHKYGFILRYPEGKENITGIDYEPWHYRYVGKDAAETIYEKGYVLEEYLESIK
jgi:D-alanyl-D-alanine carboxypeptidase